MIQEILFAADPSMAAAVFAASLISSIVGFAFAALAGAPLLFLSNDPLQTVTIVVTCSLALQAYCVWALRRSIAWRALMPFIAGGAPAVPIGVWLLASTPNARFALVLGLLVTLYAAYRLWHGKLRIREGHRWQEVLVGALGGLVGGFSGLAGMFPAIWCELRGMPKERSRALYQPYILAMQAAALACLRTQTPAELPGGIVLVYVPVAVMGAMLGLAIFRRLSNRHFNWAVNVLLLVSGIALVGRLL